MKFKAHRSKAGDRAVIITGLPTPLIIAVHPKMPLDAMDVIINNLTNIFHIIERDAPNTGLPTVARPTFMDAVDKARGHQGPPTTPVEFSQTAPAPNQEPDPMKAQAGGRWVSQEDLQVLVDLALRARDVQHHGWSTFDLPSRNKLREVISNVTSVELNPVRQRNYMEEAKKVIELEPGEWNWRTDWCKEKGLNPTNDFNWRQSKAAYDMRPK